MVERWGGGNQQYACQFPVASEVCSSKMRIQNPNMKRTFSQVFRVFFVDSNSMRQFVRMLYWHIARLLLSLLVSFTTYNVLRMFSSRKKMSSEVKKSTGKFRRSELKAIDRKWHYLFSKRSPRSHHYHSQNEKYRENVVIKKSGK